MAEKFYDDKTSHSLRTVSPSDLRSATRYSMRSRSNTASSSEATTRTDGTAKSRRTIRREETNASQTATSRGIEAVMTIAEDSNARANFPYSRQSRATPSEASHAVDDSDTDFQSAYSTSPRESYCSLDTLESQEENSSNGDKFTPNVSRFSTALGGFDAVAHSNLLNTSMRQRVSSTATATPASPNINSYT